MGVVFAARHVDLDTRVAIKAILPEMQLVSGVVSRFAREAKAAVAIRSEHVAQVFDVGTDEELGPFIVMEFLEGRDLRAALELEGRVPLRRAVDYVLQACEALAAAHSRGIIHRDIKPENLFLTRQGNLEVVKLLDFGISKAALTGQLFGGELSTDDASCLMGTPLYMSPEQIRSLEHVDARADIWSLGAVFYELVTGQSAFSGTASLPALLKSILEDAPAPLAQHCDVEGALQGVIDLCLQKDPARRFQNVAELAAALHPFASSRASSERAPRHRVAIGLPATLALGASLVLLLAAGLRGVHTLSEVGVRAEPIAAAAEAPLRIEPKQDAVATDPAPEPGASRTVLIESQPSGAVVEIEGQPIGVTPLSTLLPPGTVHLALEKAGYVEAQAVLELEPGGRGSKPLHTRVVLEEARPQPTPELHPHRGHELGTSPGSRSARARPEPQRPRLRLVQD
jgi:hypothetical protein